MSTTSIKPETVVLQISSLGHIPAIKNSMFSIVKKENREWKRRCVQSFLSQLLSTIPTNEFAILTPDSLQSLTALLPADDSWRDIPEIQIRCFKCEKGQEGARIEVRKLSDS